jgi:hypothetical protein
VRKVLVADLGADCMIENASGRTVSTAVHP